MQLCKGKWTCHKLIEVVVLLAWSAALLAIHSFFKPKHTGFFCDDRSIQYPYSESTVRNVVLTCLTLFLPAAVMVLMELVLCLRPLKCCTSRETCLWRTRVGVWSRVGWYVHYFMGFLLVNTATTLLKNTTGSLRPHFLAVCQPDVNLSACVGFITDYNCTNPGINERRLVSARQSFPSGHAACAFYMSIFIILYLECSVKLQRNPLFRLTLYALPTLYAVWCSATRVTDHMHHLGDVLAGACLGTLVAVVTYYRGARDCLPDTSTGTAQNNMDSESELRGFKNCSNAATKSSDHATNSYSVNMAPSLDTNHSSNRHSLGEEDEEENSEGADAEAPATPTPLLLHQTTSLHSRASFRLERDKNKFRKFSLR